MHAVLRATPCVAQPFDLSRCGFGGVRWRCGSRTVVAGPAINVSKNGVAVITAPGTRHGRRARPNRVDEESDCLAAKQFNLALSPDGTELAITRVGESLDLWLHNLERGSVRRLTWDPCGRRRAGLESGRNAGGIRFVARRLSNLYVKEAHGAGPETRLLASDANKYPTDWSRDGRFLMYETVAGDGTGFVGPAHRCRRERRGARAVPADLLERVRRAVFAGRPLGGIHVQRERPDRGVRPELSGRRREVADLDGGGSKPVGAVTDGNCISLVRTGT